MSTASRYSGALFLAILAALATGCAREPTAPQIPALADTLFGAGNTRWFVLDTMGGGVMPPVIDAERIYVARGEFKPVPEIQALERATGALRWRQRALTSFNGPALAGDILGVPFGGLQRFNRTTGAQAPNAFFSTVTSNVVSDGTRLFVGTRPAGAAAVNATTGVAEWQTQLDGTTSGGTSALGIAFAGDRVAVSMTYYRPPFTPADSGMVALLDRTTGAVKWRRSFPGAVWSAGFFDPPVFSGSVVGAVTLTHMVYALDLASGATRWTYDATRGDPGHASFGIAACEGAIFVSDGNLGLVSLDAETGAENWRLADLQIGSVRSIQCSYGTVIAMASWIKVFDARSGAVLRRVPAADRTQRFIMTVARDESSIYVVTDRGFGAMKAP